MRIVTGVFKALVLAVGLIALLHVVSRESEHPLVLVAEVDGESMSPTLHSGERLLCVRTSWKKGSIVVADVGESCPVVKRVGIQCRRSRYVHLVGDNQETSQNYWGQPEAIKSVVVCRLPLPLATRTTAACEDSAPAVPAYARVP